MKTTLTSLIFVILFLFTNAQSSINIRSQIHQNQSTKANESDVEIEERGVRVHLDPGQITVVQLNENCIPFQIPFFEGFDGESVGCWVLPEGVSNWGFGEFYTPPSTSSGVPNAFFNWSPYYSNYSHSLTSLPIDATGYSDIKLNYLLFLNRFSSGTLEQMSVEYKKENDENYTLLETFDNQGPTNLIEFVRTEQALVGMAGNLFQIRFRAHGQNSFNLNGWGLDDVMIYGTTNEMLLGDANCDDTVDVLDVITTINEVLELSPDPFCFNNADWNADEIIDVLDVIGIIGIILGDSGGGDDFVCGTSTITDVDGNEYNTVLIGEQCWTRESLRTTKYNNNDPINFIGDNNQLWAGATSGAYSWINNSLDLSNLYGFIYNWYAVNDPRGLCPEGWHVPSLEEWSTLENYLPGPGKGNKLKSCRQIDTPLGGDCQTTEHPRWEVFNVNIHGTDDYGFSALPGGQRTGNGNFNFLGTIASFWTSTMVNDGFSYGKNLEYTNGEIFTAQQVHRRGMHVRCIKD